MDNNIINLIFLMWWHCLQWMLKLENKGENKLFCCSLLHQGSLVEYLRTRGRTVIGQKDLIGFARWDFESCLLILVQSQWNCKLCEVLRVLHLVCLFIFFNLRCTTKTGWRGYGLGRGRKHLEQNPRFFSIFFTLNCCLF